MRLFDFLFPPRVDEKVLRGTSADDFFALVAPRLVPETRPGAITLLPFHDEQVRAALHEAKYHGSSRAFTLLGGVLAEYLRGHEDLERRKAIIVPVPLGAKRLKERGFNQVEEVAQRALHELGKGADIRIDAPLLTRTRETVSQVSLPRERREENMRGAFGAARKIDPSYLYIVLDDVLTTGATLQAAIDALTAAGVRDIIPIALAH
jgi:predicted amidophosphoribosyltransferase